MCRVNKCNHKPQHHNTTTPQHHTNAAYRARACLRAAAAATKPAAARFCTRSCSCALNCLRHSTPALPSLKLLCQAYALLSIASCSCISASSCSASRIRVAGPSTLHRLQKPYAS